MTDRHSGYIVTLTDDVREDNQAVITAILMVRGVAAVSPVTADLPELMARDRLRVELRRRLYEAIDQVLDA